MATPDKHEPGLRIIQCAKLVSPTVLSTAYSKVVILGQIIRELLAEVPDADFIEIRAIRYDVPKEGTDERDVKPAPPGE